MLCAVIALLATTAQTPALSAPGSSGKPPGPAAGMAGQSSSPRQETPAEATEPLPAEAKQSFKTRKQADRMPQEVEEKRSTIKRGYSCDELRRDPAKRNGGAVCAEEREAPAPAAARAAADNQLSCEGGTAIIQVTRFSICSVRYWGVIVYDTDGSKFGSADITTGQEINTEPRASDFSEDFSMRVDRMDPVMASVLVSVDASCTTTSCYDGGQDPWAGALTLPPVGTSYEGTVHRSWTNANADDSILLSWTLMGATAMHRYRRRYCLGLTLAVCAFSFGVESLVVSVEAGAVFVRSILIWFGLALLSVRLLGSQLSWPLPLASALLLIWYPQTWWDWTSNSATNLFSWTVAAVTLAVGATAVAATPWRTRGWLRR